MRQFGLLILIGLIVSSLGCKKDPGITYYQISSETLDWIFYKPGSYWIFQDSTSKQYDSIYVDSSSVTKLFHERIFGRDDSYFHDELFISYKDNYYSLLYDKMHTSSALTRFYGSGVSYPIFELDHNDIGETAPWYDKDGEMIGRRTVLNHYSTYQLLDESLNNVYEIEIEDFINHLTV
jgi:hypothetical protein